MFTGLVQSVGRVGAVEPTEAGIALSIEAGAWDPGCGTGGSIAVNGCCLTLTDDPVGGVLRFVAVPETLEKTNLGKLAPGDPVNLENAVTAGTPLGGHVVQGHVDGVGEVDRVPGPGDAEWRVRLAPPAGLMRFMTPKGSVCLDGVSLTIAGLEPGSPEGTGGWIEVALIPETLDKTTLRGWRAGDTVNIEADVMTKTVVHHLEHYLRATGLAASGSLENH